MNRDVELIARILARLESNAWIAEGNRSRPKGQREAMAWAFRYAKEIVQAEAARGA